MPVKSIKVSHVSSHDFLANTRVRFSEVGINTSNVTEVVLNQRESGTCFGAFPLPGQDVYIKNEDELLIDFEGVFYRAVRKKQGLDISDAEFYAAVELAPTQSNLPTLLERPFFFNERANGVNYQPSQ